MKFTKEEWKILSERVLLTLRPTQYPVVMKFITSDEEWDTISNIEFNKNPASVCKVIGMAAHSLGTFGIKPEGFGSYHCSTNNGCVAVGEQFLQGSKIYTAPLIWHHNQEDAIKHINASLDQIPKTPYKGIVCGNMSCCEIEEADVISLQLPSQAAFHLLAGFVESDYEMIKFRFSGESNCIDTWMHTKKEGKIGLSLGCRGDRATGGLGYGDVRITMTVEQLLKSLDGVDTITENGIEYPYNPTCMLRDSF